MLVCPCRLPAAPLALPGAGPSVPGCSAMGFVLQVAQVLVSSVELPLPLLSKLDISAAVQLNIVHREAHTVMN